MAKPNQDERQTQGKQQSGQETGSSRSQTQRDDQRTTSPNAQGGNQNAPKGPGREGSTGGANGKSPRDEHGRQDLDKRNASGESELEDAMETGTGSSRGSREETKSNPNTPR